MTVRGFPVRWVRVLAVALCALSAALIPDSRAPGSVVQGDQSRGTIVKPPRATPADVEASALTKVREASAALGGTLTAGVTELEVYEKLMGKTGTPGAEDFLVTILMRFDRTRWSGAAMVLAEELAKVGSPVSDSIQSWSVWSCSTQDGLSQLTAFRDSLRELDQFRAQEAIDGRVDAVGLWLARQSFDNSPVATLVGGSPFVPTTLSVFSSGGPLDAARLSDRVPTATGGKLRVGVVTDLSPKSCRLRLFDVPMQVADSLVQSLNEKPSLSVRILDQQGAQVRSSVVRSETNGAICGQWTTLPAQGRDTQGGPTLLVAPGRFVQGVASGPRPRQQPHLEMAWIAVAVINLDKSEGERASSYEVQVISGMEARKARESRPEIFRMPEWAGFMDEARALPLRGQLHARAVIALVERVVCSMPPERDVGPALQAIIAAMESPADPYDYGATRDSASPSDDPDVIKARELELRAVRWVAKQARD